MDMRKEAEELDRRAKFISELKHAKNGDRVIIPKGMSFDEASKLSQQYCTVPRIGLDYRNIAEMAYSEDQLLEQAIAKKQIGGNHYAKHTIQPWDIIDDWHLDYYLGNVIKYVLRDKHDQVEDLQKAIHYLEKKIELLKESK